jgi:signal transduction histidine kinase
VRSDRIKAEQEAKDFRKLEVSHKELSDSMEVRERLNYELGIANERLIEVDRQKTDFLNIVTHDIRTPLTSIRAYTDMLLMYKDKPETLQRVYENFLNIIKKESMRLENLVNDYLDLAKIESGRITFRSEPVNISGIISDSIVTYHGEAIERGISLRSVISEDIPVITADDGKIRQVLGNLLSNAIKYTPTGGTVTVSAEKNGDNIEVFVEDTGAGIPEEYHEKIF